MRTNKNTSKIILATIVAILATMISYSAFNRMSSQMQDQQNLIKAMQHAQAQGPQNATYAYAIATTNLKAGEIVSDQDVDFRNFDVENKDAFENRSDVVNKVLLQDIVSGDMFSTAHIAKISSDNVSLKEGYRALTLPADNFQGKSAKMNIGSVVDIYSTASDTNWVLENVKIVALEGAKKDLAAPANTGIMEASSITFEVSTGDISDFISNVSKGRLMLVSRNPKDKKTVRRKYSGGSFSAKDASLPNLPASVPITNLSGLPDPIQPEAPQASVEVIEANVKSKVTFE